MPTCKKCNAQFPSWMWIDGVKKILSSRKYCLTCSPMGQHNTKKLNGEPRQDQIDTIGYRCSCGETDPSKFYGKKKSICGKCHNAYTTRRGQDAKRRAVEYKGGECEVCGYNKCSAALDFHHNDPAFKDPQFRSMRGWTWAKIKAEIDTCSLLCKNCHAEEHDRK